MKGLKRLLPIAMAVALLVALLPGGVALAAGEGVLTNFDSNNLPDVTAVELYNSANDTEILVGAGMSPGTTYTLRVTVTDYDQLSDISQIDIAIFYDSTGSTTAPVTSVLATVGVFTCANPTAETPTLSVVGTGGTWAAGTVTKPTLTNTSGDWTLQFTVGKIAKEAEGQSAVGNDGWHLYAEVTDSESETDEMYNRGADSANTKGWAIGWYGEIGSTVVTDVDFGKVSAAAPSFTQISLVDSGAATTFSINSMANGTHKLTVAATNPSGVTFSAGDSPAANQVALVMDLDATTPAQVSGQYLATGADITGYTGLSATTASDTLADNSDSSSMWIKVGAQVTGSKSTTVTYTIVNA